MYESNDKMVSHPPHYQSSKGLEVIDVVESFTENLSGIEACDTGNIIKYACRWKQKNGIQDLEKILWYAQHLIDHLKEKQQPVMSDMTKELSECVYIPGVGHVRSNRGPDMEHVNRKGEFK